MEPCVVVVLLLSKVSKCQTAQLYLTLCINWHVILEIVLRTEWSHNSTFTFQQQFTRVRYLPLAKQIYNVCHSIN